MYMILCLQELRWVLIGLCFISSLSFAQIDGEIGKIQDSIWVDNNGTESFALYLPQSFQEDQLCSIVFIFDPAGRGMAGLKPFIQASETYGHILVCSNNAKNGPMDANFEIANRLFNFIFTNFSVDAKRINIAGFSGGSRFATAVAVLTGQMRAVIACGAGFPSDLRMVPKSPDFIYAAVVGERDMNLIEVSNNKPYLDALNFTNELFFFDGGHRWPNEDEMSEVFSWLYLQDLKDGILTTEIHRVQKLYNESYKKYSEEKNPIGRSILLKRMEKNFKTYFNTDSLGIQLQEIEATSEFKDEITNRSKIFKVEEELIVKFSDRFLKDYDNPKNFSNKWWSKEISKLNELSTKSTFYKDMVERLKYKLYELSYVRSKPEHVPVSPEQKEFCDFIITNLTAKLPD